MALVPEPPSRIAFFCELPPASGGETPILLSSELYDRVLAEAPEFVEKLQSLGLVYSRVLSDGCAADRVPLRVHVVCAPAGFVPRRSAPASRRRTCAIRTRQTC